MSAMDDAEQRYLLDFFIEHAEKRLRRMDMVLVELRQDGGDAERLDELMSMFHNLAGTGGAYGFPAASSCGQKGEALCIELMSGEQPVSEEQLTTLRGYIDEIARCLRDERAEALATLSALATPTVDAPPVQVAVLEWLDEPRQAWVAELQAAGWPAEGVSTPQEFFERFASAPVALITAAEELARSDFQFLSRVRALPGGHRTAILLVGTLADLETKVRALRMGADACFSYQTDRAIILARLEELLERRRPSGANILVTDDDPEHVSFLRAVLQPAGYHVSTCKDPRHFEHELQLARPDLLVLDLAMPTLSGTDLVRFVRQEERHRSVPIIILSAVAHAEVLADAVLAGADVLLGKPVSPEALLKAVAGCLENVRRRSYRSVARTVS